jgi:hypothetical protein
MWEALEHVGWVQYIGNTGWAYSTVAVTHYVTMFWFIGFMAIVDLRVMGLVARKRNMANLAQQLFPWAWTAFGLSVLAGFLMFATDAGDWAPSPHFHIKLGLIALSAAFALFIQWSVPKWSSKPETSSAVKLIALVALLLWIATILSASEIPALEGLG